MSKTVPVRLQVNGVEQSIDVEPRLLLVHAIRDNLGLTGTHVGCDTSNCGACTVHLDGRPALACMTLAVLAEGREVTTIEGLAGTGGLHPVQRTFIDEDALQCGYCTPGQVMSAVACVEGGHATTDDAIREFMSGNICRCSAYPQILAAIRAAAGR